MRGVRDFTPEELEQYIDDHLVGTIEASDLLHDGDRDASEDYLRSRLVALTDTFTPRTIGEEARSRRVKRLREAIFGSTAP